MCWPVDYVVSHVNAGAELEKGSCAETPPCVQNREHTVPQQKVEAPTVSTPGLFLFYIVTFQSIHSIRGKSL